MRNFSIPAVVLSSLTLATSSFAYSMNGNRTEDIRQLTGKETVADFRQVAKKAIPTVVSIKVKGQNKRARSVSSDQYADPFELFGGNELWQFFGIPHREQPPQIVEGQASGVIVSPKGYILTNSHVVHDMEDITVQLNDGREFSGKVLGDDPNSELALVKIEADNLPYLTLGNSNDLEVGQWVAAIGNPFSLQATLTVGVVSAKGRNNLDIAPFEDFIQTDAAINRGNSGGPLINLDGEVIGINTAIATTTSSGYLGIGFAIPSNMAKNFMEEILSNGRVTRGFLGVSLQTIDNSLAKAFGLNKIEGALITNVAKDSAADKAGLKTEDVILKINDHPVVSAASLRNEIYTLKPGTKIALSVWRKNQMIQLPVTLGENGPAAIAAVANGSAKSNLFGIEVGAITAEIAQKNGNIQEGVVVTKVNPTGVAAAAGLKKGALILAINRQKINSVEVFNTILAQAPKGEPVLLQIKQGDVYLFLSLQQTAKE